MIVASDAVLSASVFACTLQETKAIIYLLLLERGWVTFYGVLFPPEMSIVSLQLGLQLSFNFLFCPVIIAANIECPPYLNCKNWLTFVSECLEVAWELCNFGSSEEQFWQKKCSSFLASSAVISIHVGWNLNENYTTI